jgi:predicted nucleic acid-binding protein
MTDLSEPTRILVDTNIFIYAADPEAGDKHARANRLVHELMRQQLLVVSAPILNEFYYVATRPGKPPCLTHDEALKLVHDLAIGAEVLPLTASITLRALDAMPRHGLSFWDALVWAAARENGIPVSIPRISSMVGTSRESGSSTRSSPAREARLISARLSAPSGAP